MSTDKIEHGVMIDKLLYERFGVAKAKRLLKGRFMAKVLRLAFENVVMEAFLKEPDSDTLYNLQEINESLKRVEKAHPEPTQTLAKLQDSLPPNTTPADSLDYLDGAEA